MAPQKAPQEASQKASSSSRRRPITVAQRLALRRYAQKHPQLNQTALVTWFEKEFDHRLSQGTVSESLSKRFSHLDTTTISTNNTTLEKTKARSPQWPQLEAALFEWHRRAEQEIPISGELIKEVATRLWKILEVYKNMEVPQFSNGWLAKFKGRYGIKQRTRHGEAGSVDESFYAEQLIAVQAIAGQYHPSNIYNCDETGLFWKSTPERGLATQQIAGTKQKKDRITLHFCCNADGSDKLPLWIIGKALNPRCFGAGAWCLRGHDCFWRYNQKAWMNTQIMSEWLQWFDRRIAHQDPQRKVLLLMDNFSAHLSAVEALSLQEPLKNTMVCWLPPNTTSLYQPLDQGIIRTFKAHYRRRWLFYMCEQFEASKNPLQTVTVLKAIQWSIQAWQALSATTITNCWYHSQLIPRGTEAIPSIEDLMAEPVQEASSLVQRLLDQRNVHDIMSIHSFLNPVDEIVTNEPVDDLIAEVAQQYNTVEEEVEEGVEDNNEPPPLVTATSAIEALQTLRLFEQQQETVELEIIQQLNLHETRLYRQRYLQQHQNQLQAPITSFFHSIE